MALVHAAWRKDLLPETALQVEAGGYDLVICHHAGRFYALDGLCPHQRGPLGQGAFHEGKLVCPWHAWEFDCRTGEYDRNPAVRLAQYPVIVKGEAILVELPDDAGIA